MPVRAVARAAAQLRLSGHDPRPEIVVPLVGSVNELSLARAEVEQVLDAVRSETGQDISCPIGTMIELPRAALTADQIATMADFFSFGTNDLTQTTLGISRDDSARFMQAYVEQGIYARDPFVTLDQEGVGELVALASERGRGAKPGLKLGICGEHGGDPASIAFVAGIGLDYVSCSPWRVPIARLAAAQAAIRGTA